MQYKILPFKCPFVKGFKGNKQFVYNFDFLYIIMKCLTDFTFSGGIRASMTRIAPNTPVPRFLERKLGKEL
jgi:hypothetical protein